MKLKVYSRDWYYNAGIVGFLNVLSEGEMNIEKIKENYSNKLNINSNYIEFDTEILDDFYKKYEKQAFINMFNIERYKERIRLLKERINDADVKIKKDFIKDARLNGKIINRFIKEIYGKDIIEIFNLGSEKIPTEIERLQNIINSYSSNEDVFKYLSMNNSKFISDYLDNEVKKRICSYDKISEYILKIKSFSNNSSKNYQKCFICSEFKKEYDFNNSITQILGFNSDNSNWVWGFETSKVKICPLCALIYSCALLGMVFINRKIENDYKTFFYFINRNTNISTMYSSFSIFKTNIKKKENQDKPFHTILNEVIVEIIKREAQSVIENINFIEIVENDFGGQSTKSYNIYNYNINKELAEFIKTNIDNLPKGYYRIKETWFDIREEILRKTIKFSLDYSDISTYFYYYIQSFKSTNNIKVNYLIYEISNYILRYINKIKGGNMQDLKEIVNKAFHNGLQLGKKIEKENKIKGIAYQLLNDLKIGDRNSFMDKYMRLSMSYNSELKLGSNNELTDIDNFMSFGYAFVNGLLSNIKSQNEEGENA